MNGVQKSYSLQHLLKQCLKTSITIQCQDWSQVAAVKKKRAQELFIGFCFQKMPLEWNTNPLIDYLQTDESKDYDEQFYQYIFTQKQIKDILEENPESAKDVEVQTNAREND